MYICILYTYIIWGQSFSQQVVCMTVTWMLSPWARPFESVGPRDQFRAPLEALLCIFWENDLQMSQRKFAFFGKVICFSKESNLPSFFKGEKIRKAEPVLRDLAWEISSSDPDQLWESITDGRHWTTVVYSLILGEDLTRALQIEVASCGCPRWHPERRGFLSQKMVMLGMVWCGNPHGLNQDPNDLVVQRLGNCVDLRLKFEAERTWSDHQWPLHGLEPPMCIKHLYGDHCPKG